MNKSIVAVLLASALGFAACGSEIPTRRPPTTPCHRSAPTRFRRTERVISTRPARTRSSSSTPRSAGSFPVSSHSNRRRMHWCRATVGCSALAHRSRSIPGRYCPPSRCNRSPRPASSRSSPPPTRRVCCRTSTTNSRPTSPTPRPRQLTINVNGETYVHEAYALGLALPGEGRRRPLPSVRRWRDFLAQLSDLATLVGADELGEQTSSSRSEHAIEAARRRRSVGLRNRRHRADRRRLAGRCERAARRRRRVHGRAGRRDRRDPGCCEPADVLPGRRHDLPGPRQARPARHHLRLNVTPGVRPPA